MSPRAAGRSARILIVDDDKLAREWIRLALQDEGYQSIATARSGEEAVALISFGEHYNVVIADLHMRGLTGEDVLEGVRRVSPTTGRILIAGQLHAHESTRSPGLVDVFLEKSASPGLIQTAVDAAIAARQGGRPPA